MPESKEWIVTTSSDRPISDIAKDLKDASFSIGQVLQEVGSITGAVAEDTLEKVGSSLNEPAQHIERRRAGAGSVNVKKDDPVAQLVFTERSDRRN